MINHHPDDNLLVEYSSGSLAMALGISVNAHMQFCPQCRQRVEELNKLGGTLLNNSIAEQVSSDAFGSLMARIRSQGQTAVEPPKPALHSVFKQDPMFKHVPKVIAKLLPQNGKLKWRRASGALQTAQLKAGQNQYEIAFQKIRSGGKVVEHDHCGLEVTLVLYGSFSDEDGIYTRGDFLVRNPGEVHRPTATLNEDCLCFSVSEAPVKVTRLLGRLINPFLGFHPA